MEENSFAALTNTINKADKLGMERGARVQTEQRDTLKRADINADKETRVDWWLAGIQQSFYFNRRGCFGKNVRFLECCYINGMTQWGTYF